MVREESRGGGPQLLVELSKELHGSTPMHPHKSDSAVVCAYEEHPPSSHETWIMLKATTIWVKLYIEENELTV